MRKQKIETMFTKSRTKKCKDLPTMFTYSFPETEPKITMFNWHEYHNSDELDDLPTMFNNKGNFDKLLIQDSP